ncbi:MAG: ATP-binding protein [Aestuariivita sp.]|nr:ATP-binding protein [Aestuariivita sp.]
MDLQSRMNLITGDNGLGKSFLLDIAWWALTRNWPRDLNHRLTSGYPARPKNVANPAILQFKLSTNAGSSKVFESTYSAKDESWTGQIEKPLSSNLVIYAHADGGFSVWDPARNYWKTRGNINIQDRLPGYVFSPRDVWNGLTVPIEGRPAMVCKGIIDDWSTWIRENGDNAHRMAEVVGALSVDDQPCVTGTLLRLSVNDVRDIPTILTEYAGPIPIVHTSSAIRRIIALAYMLVWAWSEHVRAAAHINVNVAGQVILLFDEIEAHLHPRWQRTIVPALLKVMDHLTREKINVQIVAATHSPLVLASIEPHFDEDRDRLFHLDIHENQVQLDSISWAIQGDAINWLVSDAFGLRQARSIEAERAIDAAQAYMRGEAKQNPKEFRDKDRIHAELCRVVPGNDPFWPRWIVEVQHNESGL